MKHLGKTASLLLVSCFLMISMSATSVWAHSTGDGSPPHSVRGVSCEYLPINGQVVVKAFPPNHATAWSGFSDDVVYWTPILYRWDGSDYVEWFHSPNAIAYAYVHQTGFYQGINPGWRHSTIHGQLQFHPFYNLPSGTYTVLNLIQWHQNGHEHYEWAPNACTI
ncbi:hypothetical protein [Planococcus salinus]|uniref:Uncharacterized protein n=1 Tax=Planococcus salinus TaxID=1848460 RepID=A0A3M8P7C7_9BACL|nr:hypothetical protein [Planococcus salinus]RNF39576.1 hypothetical protein EEX84_08870 [Planococcus salinus]